MIRMILLALAMAFIGISSIFTYPIAALIGLFNKRKKENFALSYVKFAMRLFLLAAGTKVEYVGMEYLPKDGEAVVYIGNHRSFFDVIATYAVMPSLTGFIAKKEMRSWPFISWWMRDVHCLFLDRSNARAGVKTIIEGVENIKNGVSMVIYPEGTRSRTEGHVGNFHGGSFKLATKSGAKIIPVVYNNSGAIWDDHLPWVKKTTMRLEFLEPVETKGMSKEDLNALPLVLHDLIQSRHIENAKSMGIHLEDTDNDR